jgi:hypothetical protein
MAARGLLALHSSLHTAINTRVCRPPEQDGSAQLKKPPEQDGSAQVEKKIIWFTQQSLGNLSFSKIATRTEQVSMLNLSATQRKQLVTLS